MNKKQFRWHIAAGSVIAGVSLSPAMAGQVMDRHGNVGYDTQAECDAAVLAGRAKFYQPFTTHPPLRRPGEVDVKVMRLGELVAATETAQVLGFNAQDFANGACDIGVGRSNNRDGVSPQLVGKWVPFGPRMPVNAYTNASGTIVRASMQKCDNNFAGALPRPVPNREAIARTAPTVVAGVAPTDCFATVVTPAKFENREERVLKAPATKRYEAIAPTFRTVTDQVLVAPAYTRQIPVPATYKTVDEDVVTRPETFREEPIPATYKMVTERVLIRPESKRLEVIPPTFRTVTEKVLVTPERKEIKLIPATYGEREETVVLQPATVRVETLPATFKTQTEQVLLRPESVSYAPIALPMRVVSERLLAAEATSRLEPTPAAYRTVSDRVVVREASKRLEVVPAVFETITERIKVSDAVREWKQGRAWVGQAIEVRPIRGFLVGGDGKVDGAKVDTSFATANNVSLDDDVMCLVETPERFETITKQVLRSPAMTREVEVPAEYGYVSKQVLDQPPSTRKVDVPAVYQTVTRQVVDVDALRAQGYKFDDKGDITATPKGERVLRASSVPGFQAAAGAGGAGAAAAGGLAASSGQVGFVREVRVPAEYQTVTRQVVDQAARTREVAVPAITQVVKRRVELSAPKWEEVVIPAVYRDVTRQVVDKPASVQEFVVPAEYRTIERREVASPASTKRIPVAAVVEKMPRRVIDQPASYREETVPAVYRAVTRQVIEQPASVREIDVPEQYETIVTRVKVAEAVTERRAILCDTNATPAKIREIQGALLKAGFNPGPIDGRLRAATMHAVNRYQQSKGLPTDGYLNLETVKSLGVAPF